MVSIPDESYRELEEALGAEYVSREPAVLDGYAYYTLGNFNPPWEARPGAVVLPGNTEDVQKVVKICNKYKIKFKPLATGWEKIAAVGYEGAVQIDLKRMNRIIEIDEKNMYAIVEPCCTYAQLQAEAMKRGLNCHIIGAGSGTSAMASSTSHMGIGMDTISMGGGPCNILSVEWVLPDGDLLKLGSLGSDESESLWFNGDGPGPSLRSVMRGWMGAHGGIGVFTRCALKLYNWAGPKETKVDGVLLDSKAETSENQRIYICLLPDWEQYGEYLYKLIDAEIAVIQCKNAIGSILACFLPRLFKKITGTKNMKDAIGGAFQHLSIVTFDANSKRELEYQEKTLRQIVSETGGVLIDVSKLKALHGSLYWNIARASIPPLIFRAGGNFLIGFPQEEVVDAGIEQAKFGAEVKKEFIESGVLIDDFGDNSWGGIIGEFNVLHQEELAMYDHRKHSIEGFFNKINNGYIENKLGMSFIFCFDDLHDKYGPLGCNYHLWQRKIKTAFDKDDIADSSCYIKSEGSR